MGATPGRLLYVELGNSLGCIRLSEFGHLGGRPCMSGDASCSAWLLGEPADELASQTDAGAGRAQPEAAEDMIMVEEFINSGPDMPVGAMDPRSPVDDSNPMPAVPTGGIPMEAEPGDFDVPVVLREGVASQEDAPVNYVSRGTPPGDVVNALIFLRPNVTVSLEGERTRLHFSRLAIGKKVKSIRVQLNEERDKLKFIARKVAEKSDSHGRAHREFVRAREVLEAAKFDNDPPANDTEKKAIKTFIRMCEKLVKSWHDRCNVANSRLQSWEFKLKMQTERVDKISAELAAEDAIAKDKLRHLDMKLNHLHALGTYLVTL